MSPVGHSVPVVVDAGLAAYDVIWAPAGTPKAVYRTTFDELVAVTGGDVVDVRVDAADAGTSSSAKGA